VAFGYAEHKLTVIPNGIDTDEFHADGEARFSVRSELGIPPSTPLVGLVARFDPQKDHRNFVQAAAAVHACRPDVHFLLCGIDVNLENVKLAGWIGAAGLQGCFHLLGDREDVSRLTAALDVAALSSTSEALPNVVGEAMACGVPCACTDVGDAAGMVGETGRIVPPKNPRALAEAITSLLAMDEAQRARLGSVARSRIRERYLISDVALRYQSLYQELLEGN
jgi:glycosyltransferase involved in cell wall biosynthesis